MDIEIAKEIIRGTRNPEGFELEGYLRERADALQEIKDGEELLDDFNRWKERNDLFFEKVQDRNYWSSL